MLQVARGSTIGEAGGAETSALRSHFDRHHWIRVTGMLESGLLRDIQERLARAEFVERVHAGVTPPSVDLCMVPNAAAALLELAFNDPAVLRWVERITGCEPLTRFGGFVYRLSPGYGHQHHWHNDLVEGRRVAMSVNLGPGAYEGGLLELRDRGSAEVLARIPNIGPGDALLFRIDAALQHRATAVTAGVKTAFAGWYFSAESYAACLRDPRQGGRVDVERTSEASEPRDPPSPRRGFGEVSPEPAHEGTRAEADGAKPPGKT